MSKERICWVYVVGLARKTSPCKIGVAFSPQARFKNIQTHHYEDLVIRAAYPFPDKATAHLAETEVRHEFADKKIRGEWFQTTWMIISRLIVDRCGHMFAPDIEAETMRYPHPSHDEDIRIARTRPSH